MNALHTPLKETLQDQKESYNRSWTLLCDIDNTIYRENVDNTPLQNWLSKHNMGLVYVSGRAKDGMVELICNQIIAIPHILVSSGGTEIYYTNQKVFKKKPSDIVSEDFIQDTDYVKEIQKHNFNKAELHKKGEEVIEYAKRNYPEFDFRFQDIESKETWQTVGMQQNPYKLSFNYTFANKMDTHRKDALLDYITNAFKGFHVVNSLSAIDRSKNYWCLDVLPFNKRDAVKFLEKKLNLKGFIAGDSGNDSDMLLGDYDDDGRKFVRIIVGGATDQLLEDVDSVKRHTSLLSWVQGKTNAKGFYVFIEKHPEHFGPESILCCLTSTEKEFVSNQQ